MPDKEKIVAEIEDLLVKYTSKDGSTLKDMSEANVRKDFIDPFFEILGWEVRNADEYDAESYVRGVGFADVAIKVDRKPKMFIEAKKFGGVPSRRDRSVQITLKGHKIYADWTDEERQVLNYAGNTVGVKWAILTNFEKLRLFNAKTGETVLNIEKPSEYLEKIDDILLLTKENVSNNNINMLEDRVERPDVDIHFLNLIRKWQLILANEIYNNDPSLNLEEINLYVQRILDRLVIVRFAEDNWVLNNPDQLKTIRESANRSDYVSLTDMIINFFNGFDDVHNSKIFEKNEKINEIIRNIDDKVFNDLIEELYNQSFRKFTSDILGNTYESYLSSKLCLEDGKVHLQYMGQSRKDQGIFYTPPYIVDHIINNTLGEKLENLWREVIELFNHKNYEQAVLRFEDIYNIKILDSACGSGSFLIKAHDLFVKYYDKYFEEIEKAKEILKKRVVNGEFDHYEYERIKQKMELPLKNYERRILKHNIYGVDIDENAAEIASVNLMLRALKPREKLPLILYENIKVGNSLITGVEDYDELISHTDNVEKLIEYREQIKTATDTKEKALLENNYEKLKQEINRELNLNLDDYFKSLDEIKPFNWEIEFPEVFYDNNGEIKDNGGFDVVIGNPPYFNLETIKNKEINEFFEDFYESYRGKADILYFFLEKGMSLLNNEGTLGYIVANYFLQSFYADKIRKKIQNSSIIRYVINFGSYKVFQDANVDTCIIILNNGNNENNLVRMGILFDENSLDEYLVNSISKDEINKALSKTWGLNVKKFFLVLNFYSNVYS